MYLMDALAPCAAGPGGVERAELLSLRLENSRLRTANTRLQELDNEEIDRLYREVLERDKRILQTEEQLQQTQQQLQGTEQQLQQLRSQVTDLAENTYILFGCCVGAFGLAMYAAKRVLLNNTAGAYWDINLRGDPMKQSEEGRGGWEDRSQDKHSLFWHVAQYKVDDNGANIGILWDNRTRPHQYSRPGTAGVGSGISMNQGF